MSFTNNIHINGSLSKRFIRERMNGENERDRRGKQRKEFTKSYNLRVWWEPQIVSCKKKKKGMLGYAFLFQSGFPNQKHYWHFGLHHFCCGGTERWIVGCLATSLISTHQTAEMLLLPEVTAKNVSWVTKLPPNKITLYIFRLFEVNFPAYYHSHSRADWLKLKHI